MTFTDANSTHRNGQDHSLFGEVGRYAVASDSNVSGRQSVNISQETMERVAKRKLASVVTGKVGYNRFGALGGAGTIGQHLLAKA